MRRRSLAVTLALAFGGTTLAVFALVGSYLYLALERQIKSQDDLEIVLAARHARRLGRELQNADGFLEYNERLTSTVLGNQAMSIEVFGPDGRRLLEHNVAQAFAGSEPADAADESDTDDMGGQKNPAGGAPPAITDIPASYASATQAVSEVSGVATLDELPLLAGVPDSARITEASIGNWTGYRGAPTRGILAEVLLRNGETAHVLIARNMTDRGTVLDHYRDNLQLAGVGGLILSLLLGYVLIHAAMRPLRDIADSAGLVTVNRLHTRIEVARVPGELEALVESLNSMLGRVDDGFQRLSRFTADLAHDLRTPLGNMRGAAEVALARPRSVGEYQSLLASNVEECDRLSRMIENVLFLARADHPQFVKRMATFAVADELTRVADYFEGIAEEAHVHLRVTGAAVLVADVDLFRRAVSNLLANAIRYTPVDGEIVLDATDTGSATGSEVRVSVTNEGQPIDGEYLELIFERFYRIDPSRSALPSSGLSQASTGSAGLGLAIVRTIMELHGGSVHAERAAHGTRFILRFVRA